MLQICFHTGSSDTTSSCANFKMRQDLPTRIHQIDMHSLNGLVVNNRQRFCRLLVSCPQVGIEIQAFDNQGLALECAQSDYNTLHLTCKSHIVCTITSPLLVFFFTSCNMTFNKVSSRPWLIIHHGCYTSWATCHAFFFHAFFLFLLYFIR